MFSEEEFKEAFIKVDKDGSGFITPDEVEELLFETYGFPPLDEEVTLFMKEFDLNQDGKVSWDEFVASMTRIKEKMDSKADQAKEYSSFNKFTEDRFKHKRPAVEVQDKYKHPMTMSQSVGFHHKDETQKMISMQDTYPNHKCDETRFAEEMIKTGFNVH